MIGLTITKARHRNPVLLILPRVAETASCCSVSVYGVVWPESRAQCSSRWGVLRDGFGEVHNR
jgi:hypothetical protein